MVDRAVQAMGIHRVPNVLGSCESLRVRSMRVLMR